MASRLAKVVITLDGKRVEVGLDKIRAKIEELTKEMNELALAGKQNTKDFKEKQKAIDKLQKAEQDVVDVTKRINTYMKDLGNVATTDLRRAYREGIQLRDSFKGNSTELKKLNAQLAAMKKQIDTNTGAVSKHSSAWKTAYKNLFAYVGLFGLFNMAKTKLTDLVSKNKELSDSMANIRKVSQWAASDVEQLTKNLSKIDTRNTLSTLQQLAYEGAKLGIGEYGLNSLTGFVKAAEQVQTALGEDLGEDTLPALAKLTEVMGLIPKFGVEQAMQKAGSAIYQLGATSTATGRDIIEFSKRIMGLANVAGVTSSELLGLAGASSTMAIMPEVGATAFNKLFNSIHANTEGIAKAVGLAKEELTDLLYEGRTMDALVKVFEKMQTMSMAELEGRGVFKALGSDGSRLTNVMITMANKVDMLKDSLKTSNEAFSEGKAVINEYMIQNETAAAYFERASNIWEKSFVNPEGVDIVKRLAQEWYNVSYEMTHSASVMAEINLTLSLIAGAAKMLVQLLPTLIQLMFFYGVGKILQGIIVQFRAWYTAATMTGTAMARLNVLMKANAVALFVTGLGLVAAKLIEVTQASKMAAEEEKKRQQVFTDAAAEAMQTYRDQAKALEKYEDALKKSNTSEAERNDIIRQFKSEFGAYLEKLGIEINTYKDMELALKRVNKELKDKAFYETGKALEESYVGDAKSEQTRAMSKYMQVAAEKGLSTDVLLQIKEGKAGTRQQSIVKAFESMDNGQMLGKLYSQLSSGGVSYNALSDDVRQFVKQQFGSGESISNVWESLKDVADAAGTLYDTSQEVIKREGQVNKFIEDNAAKYSPNISVEGALGNLKELKKLNEDKLQEGLNTLRDEWKKMNEAETTLKDADAGKITLTPAERSKHTSLLASRNKKDLESGIEQYSAEIRSRRGEGYTPPPTKKELAAAEREQRKAYRDELKKAVEESNAVIAKIEEWYRLQETVITNMYADGKLTKEQSEQVIRTLNIAKNQSLGTARRAIATGNDTEWKELRTHIGELSLDAGQWSQDLLKDILEVNLQKSHATIAKFDGSKAVLGVSSTADFDKISKNAAGNFRVIARLQAKGQEEVQKMLDQYHFVEQAMKGFSDRLAQMGILTETARQMAQRLSDANDAETLFSMKDYNALLDTQEQSKKQMLQAFLNTGTAAYAVNPENDNELRSWFMDFVGSFQEDASAFDGVAYKYQSWAEPFKDDFEQWLRDSEQYADKIQEFYFSLLGSSDEYYKAQRQQYEFYKKQNEQQWENSGRKDYYDQQYTRLGNQQQLQDTFGTGQNFWQQTGFADAIAKDPEVELYKQKLQAAAEYFQFVESHQHTEQELREAQQATIEAYMAMAKKVTEEVAERASKISTLSEPFTQFAQDVGQKWGDALFNMESSSDTWNAIVKKMILSFAQMTIKMTAENLTKKIQMALFYKQMQAMEIEHQTTLLGIQTAFGAMKIGAQQALNTTSQAVQTADNTTTIAKEVSLATILTSLGISEGAAKIIGKLGWWGIPLVGVIASLLMGLLASALSTAGKSSDTSTSTSSSSATKTKLVSGMLTYDEGTGVPDTAVPAASPSGNKQSYLGTDGRVYRATPQQKPLSTGLITQPIATTVNGRPALVAERGPEIVIGRRTTRHIMMNEPGLLRHLQQYDRHYSPRPYAARGLRPYDDGNIAESVLGGSAAENAQQSNDRDTRLADTLTLLTAAVQQLQQSNASLEARLQKPIQASINKYGTNGLIEEVQSGLKFYNKYNK